MDTKGEPGSEGLTPRQEADIEVQKAIDKAYDNQAIAKFKDRVAEGEYDRLQNGAEVYESPNGMRFVIQDQEGADLIVGKDQPPKTESFEEGHTIIAPARDLHQEALDANARANEGFKPLTPMSENGKDFFAKQDEIAEQARRDARHQEALDSNARANEGFKPLTPMSENGKDFFAKQDEIAEQARRDARHQEALDSNARANEGFKPLTPMSENGQDFFAKQDEIAKKARGEQEEADVTPEKTPEELRIEIQGLRDENQRLLAERNALIVQRNEGMAEVESLRGEVSALSQEVARLAALLEANGITPEVTPVTPEVPPVTPEVPPVTPEVPPVTPEVTPVTPEVTPVTPEVTPVTPEVTPVTPEVTPVTPEVTPVTPEVPPVTPEVPPVTPEVTPVTPEVTPVTPEVTPVTPGVTRIEPPVQPQVTPEMQAAANADILELRRQLADLRGENTPEQRSAALGAQLAQLEQIQQERELTDAEKILFFNLTREKSQIDRGIASVEGEMQARRENKEKWIKRAGFVAGIGVALATPAVGVAAIIAVTLGGNVIGRGLKKLEGRVRAKSSAMKYESRTGKSLPELAEMDKKQKRSEWWANRLGEASALLIGGASGYGFGSIIQNVFGVGFGAGAPTPPTPEVPPTGEITPPTGEIVPPNTGGGELPPTGEIIPPVEGAGESVLVQDGRIDLPGSAWDGNLASGPAQDTLLGGANNPSNFNGGLHEMAPFRLEEALVQNGITRAELTSQLDTAQIHQLLNRSLEATRSGNPIDLAQMLDSVKPGVSDILLGGN